MNSRIFRSLVEYIERRYALSKVCWMFINHVLLFVTNLSATSDPFVMDLGWTFFWKKKRTDFDL